MIFRYIARALRDTFKSIARSPIHAIINIITITCMLFVLSLMYVVIANINSITESFAGNMEVVVFYKDNATQAEMLSFEDSLLIDGKADEIIHVSKKDAFLEFKESWADSAHLLEGYTEEDNPFPSSARVKVMDPSKIPQLEEAVDGVEIVESFNSYREVAKLVDKLAAGVKIGGLIIFAILAIVSMIVISNTVKLTIMSKKEQLDIMYIVGSPSWYIRLPFIMQSAIFGIVGGLIASITTMELYRKIIEGVQVQDMIILSGILPASKLIAIVYTGTIFIGIVFGVITAYLSANRGLAK